MRAQVGAAPATDLDPGDRLRTGVNSSRSRLVDLDLPGARPRVLPAPRKLVGALAVELDGREGGRLLEDAAGERGERAPATAAVSRLGSPTGSTLALRRHRSPCRSRDGCRRRRSSAGRSANSARRVADSKRIGRTPVASGSSVPACPTRWAPVSSAQAADDREGGLARRLVDIEDARREARLVGSGSRRQRSPPWRPPGPASRPRPSAGRSPHRRRGCGRRRRTSRTEPAASTGAAAAHADLGQRRPDFLEQDRELEARDAVERVDDALGLGHHGVGLAEHPARHPRPGQPARRARPASSRARARSA